LGLWLLVCCLVLSLSCTWLEPCFAANDPGASERALFDGRVFSLLRRLSFPLLSLSRWSKLPGWHQLRSLLSVLGSECSKTTEKPSDRHYELSPVPHSLVTLVRPYASRVGVGKVPVSWISHQISWAREAPSSVGILCNSLSNRFNLIHSLLRLGSQASLV
jgi:hypothetical protein